MSYSALSVGGIVYELVAGDYGRREVVDLVSTEDDVRALLETDDGRIAVDAVELESRLVEDDPSWVASFLEEHDDSGNPVWIPHPRRTDREADVEEIERVSAPSSPRDLTVELIESTGSRTAVNAFLEGGSDGLVFHALGSVSSWRAAFVARNEEGEILSALTLHHYHPSTNGVEIAITRVANHETAPHNLSSYMISRARKYAERTGYERIASYAGVDSNEGVCYRAAGFDREGEPVEVEGKNWTDDHHGDGDGSSWFKQKYAYELEPDKYADKSEEWAVETVADGRLVPGRAAYESASPSRVRAD